MKLLLFTTAGMAMMWSGDASCIDKVVLGSFATTVIRDDGKAIAFGNMHRGGDTRGLDLSAGVVDVVSTRVSSDYDSGRAFAALKDDGSVLAWGQPEDGGDMGSLTLSSGVVKVVGSGRAFAALKSDGTVATWGNVESGGDSSTVAAQLTNVKDLFATESAFTALKNDGRLVSWGNVEAGGSFSSLDVSGVSQVYSDAAAFVALKTSGAVIAWGKPEGGGTTPAGSAGPFVEVVPIGFGFVAYKANGEYIVWGDAAKAIGSVSLAGGIKKVATSFRYNQGNYLVLKKNGVVVSWGKPQSAAPLAGLAPNDVSEITRVQNHYAIHKKGGVVRYWDANNPGTWKEETGIVKMVDAVMMLADGTVKQLFNDGTIVDVTAMNQEFRDIEQVYFMMFTTDANLIGVKADGTIVSDGTGWAGAGVKGVTQYRWTRISKSDFDFFVFSDNNEARMWGMNEHRLNGYLDKVQGKIKDIVATQYASEILVTLTDGGVIRKSLDGTVQQSQLPSPAKTIAKTSNSFAVLMENNLIATFGDSATTSIDFSEGVDQIYANWGAFAAIMKSGKVLVWGNQEYGGNQVIINPYFSTGTNRPDKIVGKAFAFASLQATQIISWGDVTLPSPRILPAQGATFVRLEGDIDSFQTLFVAVDSLNNIVAWNKQGLINLSSQPRLPVQDMVFNSGGACAIVFQDSSVISFGDAQSGGNSATVNFAGGVQKIVASSGAFAALKKDGSIVAWGNEYHGGVPGNVNLQGPFKDVYAGDSAFVAARTDGRLVVWGTTTYGGANIDKLNDVTAGARRVLGNGMGFAVLKGDGTLDGWGSLPSFKNAQALLSCKTAATPSPTADETDVIQSTAFPTTFPTALKLEDVNGEDESFSSRLSASILLTVLALSNFF